MSHLDQRNFLHLSRRAIIPLVASKAEAGDLPDISNVQGDIIHMFPKKAENFIFFRIADTRAFKAALKVFEPHTASHVQEFLHEISLRKQEAASRGTTPSLIKKYMWQIAFTRMGMNFLGQKGATGDERFDTHAMRDDKDFLGDQRDWDPIFDKKNFDSVNGSVNDDTGALHGVFTVAASDADTCQTATKEVTDLFGLSMIVVGIREGRARPPPYTGHEHFGYEDGVSQPALRGLHHPHKGQVQVDPGVIVMGYKGDPLIDNPYSKVKRPAWAKDGTMMIFRKLEQAVPEFQEYLDLNGPRWREFIPGGEKAAGKPLTNKEGADLFGARLIGRWKSGAPIMKAPIRDDPEMAKDKERNNDFDYRITDHPNIAPNELTDLYCPFNAHIRKTAPRDLDPYVSQKYLESGMIVRAGLPYGIEVTPEEWATHTSSTDEAKKRGLLFISYQSSLDQGFIRQTKSYAGNDFFPTTSLVPQRHGQDPILGSAPPVRTFSVNENTDINTGDPLPSLKQGDEVNMLYIKGDKQIKVTGFAEVTSKGFVPSPGSSPGPNDFFVTSRGGEYFFVPSISTLKKWTGDTNAASLDVMFVLDATSSMQKYIDQVRTSIDTICNDIVASGNWEQENIRIGLVAFRDHPQDGHEYGFVSKAYGFKPDIASFKRDLAALEAAGGGDGCEAQCDALNDALNARWNDKATKIAVLVTDSPPHGIKEYDDQIPTGCPRGLDAVSTANSMAKKGITLHVLACEPTLSGKFSKAHDFYTGITRKTGGRLIPLSDEKALASLIIGTISETSDIEGAVRVHKDSIIGLAKQGARFDSISNTLYSRLSSAGTHLHSFDVENIYEEKPDGDYNADVWFNATTVDEETNRKIKTVKGFRIKSEYRRGSNAPASSLVKKLVTKPHCETIVRASLARE